MGVILAIFAVAKLDKIMISPKILNRRNRKLNCIYPAFIYISQEYVSKAERKANNFYSIH